MLALASFDGRPAGLVTAAQLRAVPVERRNAVRVAAVATGPEQGVTVAPDEPLTGVLARRPDGGQDHALVADAGTLVGVLTPQDVARAVELGRLGLHLGRTRSGWATTPGTQGAGDP